MSLSYGFHFAWPAHTRKNSNEEFAQTDSIRTALDRVFDFVDRCGFPDGSRAWKQTDLFTLLVEFYAALVTDKLDLDAAATGARIQAFYGQVDELYAGKQLPAESEVPTMSRNVFAYLKAATKATNDKYARVERARIVADLIRNAPAETIAEKPDKPVKRGKKK